MDKSELRIKIKEQQAIIDDAYFSFSRSKNKKPPIMTVPDAYRKRNDLIEMLQDMMRLEDGT